MGHDADLGQPGGEGDFAAFGPGAVVEPHVGVVAEAAPQQGVGGGAGDFVGGGAELPELRPRVGG
ncbi:MAG TPA: hypothetical protein PJ982_10125, partial [Lacipirellulaceae bacterium]|nr:hypothetical protein [Lacipirellulaceae bacterium]